MSYSPHLRTAVLLSGTGTAGAYHAGVLRAFHESGIKIDVMSGRGIGAAGALFAAIDAAPKTWEDGGLWRRTPGVHFVAWRPALKVAALLGVLAAAILLVPLLVLATGLIAYPLAFLVQLVSASAGQRLAMAYASMIAAAFEPDALPSMIPRLVTMMLVVGFIVLAVSAFRSGRRTRASSGQRDRGRWWGRLVGSPWSSSPGLEHCQRVLWELFRGPTRIKQPGMADLSRRYTELLIENLGQPGFRELIVTSLDLETRTDLIFAALREERRPAFFNRGDARAGSAANGELIDLAGIGRNLALDALGGALSLPVLTDPHPVAFSPESYWKGETHRTCDRPAALGRLLDELEAAGVEQVIVVSADANRAAPHRLSTPPASLASRLSEHLSAAEAVATRDAVAAYGILFRAVFLIQPAHNPIGPFDFDGAYDERSDRYQSLGELIDRGYQDAYRQFIGPIVGEGG